MRRSLRWLLLAVLLFGVGAWLMSQGETKPGQPNVQVSLPNSFRSHEHTRMVNRRRTPPLEPANVERPHAPTDPVLRALPSVEGRSTVILEANALRHSSLGELMVDCLRRDELNFEQINEQYGIDLLEELDRVAIGDDFIMVSGHLERARWNEIFFGADESSYGDNGTIFEHATSDECAAVWNNEMVLAAKDCEALEEAIDRIEGRSPVVSPLGEEMTYGEIYGVIDPTQLANLLPEKQAPIRDRLLEVVERVELHVDAMHDVGIVAHMAGPNAEDVGDLGRTIGSALAVARMTARASDNDDVAELLEYARVSPMGQSFSLEMALPKDLLEAHLNEMCNPTQIEKASMNSEELDAEELANDTDSAQSLDD